MVVAITRDDFSAVEMRGEAARLKDANAARRLLALALVMEGADRASAARQCGMDRQTLRDWVHRYNAEGVSGLINRQSPGPAPRLNTDQIAALAALVEAGPDPETDGVVRWRRVDLQKKIKMVFGVDLHERSVGKVLSKMGYVRLSTRPQHPKSEPQVQEDFKKTSPPPPAEPCLTTPAANPLRFGFKMKQGSVSRGH